MNKLFFSGLVFLFLSTLSANPISVSDLQLWLDATDDSTVLDANGFNPSDSSFNGVVREWKDKSSNNITATASVGATYSATDMNGRATLGFINASSSEQYNLSNNITTSSETIFIVTRMFDNGNNRGAWLGGSSSLLMNDADRYFYGNTQFIGNGAAPTVDTILTVTRSSGGSVNILENGISVAASTVSGSISVNEIGQRPGSSRFFFGEISSILIYNRLLDSTEMNTVGGFLENQFDISTSFDAPVPAVPEPSSLALLSILLFCKILSINTCRFKT